MELLKRLSLYIFLGLLAYIPFHIFFSTWVGSSFGVLGPAKAAKDAVMIIGFLLAVIVSLKQPWFKKLLNDKLVWLILAYGALNTVLSLLRPTDSDAELLGLVYNTRFLVFFLYGFLLSQLFEWKVLKKRVLFAAAAAGFIVLVFGVIQYTLLPNDILSHVGYSRANGVLPAFFIDDKPDLERVMSTLRDPNSLGSYIVIIGTLVLGYFYKTKDKNLKQITGGILALSILCLIMTFSRSGWLGFAASAVAMAAIIYRKKLSKKKLIPVTILVLAVVTAGVYLARDNYFVQNIIFHADESTVLATPNQLRTKRFQESISQITKEPLGHGPGTAGLASIHNQDQGTILSENYYLQIGHEVGLFGLALFVSILGIVGKRLFAQAKNHTLALGLFGSLIGLIITNFLVHIWSNEAVAYTFWGLASIGISKPKP